MGDDMSAYKDVFLSESTEYLQSISDGLLTLEAEPADLEPVETIFRGAHSLKGMAAAMGYARTQELTHKMESLMDTVRSRKQLADHTLIDLMLRATDVAREVIADESAGGTEASIDEIVAELVRRTEQASEAPAGGLAEEGRQERASDADAVDGALYRVKITLEPGCVLKGVRAYMAIKRLAHMGTVIETVPGAREIEDEQFDRSFEVVLRTKSTAQAVRDAALAVTEVEDVEVHEAEPAPSGPAMDQQDNASARRRTVPKVSETQTVRISIGHLDAIVNLVGELVIVRSRLDGIARQVDRADLDDALGVLERISADLQQEVMQTRMVPVGNIFNRFPRMVRDLSQDLGKDIAFEMGGLDIELDRTVLDEIGDPIVHLLRNSVDHGIETPEERRKAGKPARGSIKLMAEREREQIRITVQDDGKGMDLDRIWAKACERNLVDANARDSYSDYDVFMLVCLPGFSTMEEATRISGRGVGMDVVKGKIEYLGGTISLASSPGKGMSVTLVLPLTLAIIQALLFGNGDRVFALPLGIVEEVLSEDEVRFTTIDGQPVLVLRDGAPVGLQRLDALLGDRPANGDGERRRDHYILMRVGVAMRALAVEKLIGRREIVIKPLSPLFRGIGGFSGATVLGDGRVALILDHRTLFSQEG